MNCPYCGFPCTKEGKDIWICKNHGRVVQEVDKELDEDETPQMVN